VSDTLEGEMKTADRDKVLETATMGEKPHHQPTPQEIASIKAFMDARASSAPSLKKAEGNSTSFAVDHPDRWIGALDLMRALGTSDLDFHNGLMNQLIGASATCEGRPSVEGANFMLAVIKGIQPRDQVESMLAAQMAAVHAASMSMARQLATAQNLPQQDSAERGLTKLMRTFAAQVEALKSYRSKGEQKMTVQHVHVAEGGQAIVGNVSASAGGVGERKKPEVRPHALGYAPRVEMPRQIEAEREAMPVAGSAGL
jgi:hypothetical protein